MDIYSDEHISQERSFRYIHIITKNVIGILSRISSLMRRKRYNMEEVSVSFDDQGRAHMIVAIDGRLHDVHHVIEQVRRLYDVIDVYDTTHQREHLFFAIYVTVPSERDFKLFPMQPNRIVELDGVVKGIFTVSLEDVATLMDYILEEKFPYIRRIMGLI